MGTVIERQVIVTWYTPEEKLSPEFTSVVATISGRAQNTIYDHAMIMMEYARQRDGKPIEVEDGIIERLEALKADHRQDGGYYRGVRDSIEVVKEALGYGDE